LDPLFIRFIAVHVFLFRGIANNALQSGLPIPKVEGEDGPAKTIVFANSKFMATWDLLFSTSWGKIGRSNVLMGISERSGWEKYLQMLIKPW